MASDQTLPLPALSNPNQIHHTPTAPLPLPEEEDPTPPPISSSAARKLPIKRRSPPPRPSTSPSSSGPASSGADPLKQQAHNNPAFKFQRIWSESDELRFLQGLLGCGAQGLLFPRDLNVFYDRFSESMPQPYTRSQLSEKLRRLKNKHRGVAARVAKGLDPARLAPHDRDVLHLCSRLWDPANAATSPFAAPTTTGGAGSSSGNNKRRRANNNPHQGQGGGAVDLPAPSGDSYNGGISGSSAAPPGAAAFLDENGEMYLEQQSGGHNLYFVGGGGGVSLVADCNLDGVPMEQPQPENIPAAFANIIAADNGLAPPFANNIAPDNELPASFTTNIAAADNGAAAAFTTNIAAAGNGLVAPTDVPNIFGNNNNSSKVALPRSDDHRLASAVLDIFEECMREAKADGTISDANAEEESELAKRWRQQRIDELDVLSRRLRLIVEDAAPAGH